MARKNDPWAKPSKPTPAGKSSAGRGVVSGPGTLKAVGKSPFASTNPGQSSRPVKAAPAQPRSFPGEPGPNFTPKQLEQLRNIAGVMYGQKPTAKRRGQ